MSERLRLIDTINDAINHAMANLHTATIARVSGVGATTISVQPVINREVNGESIRLPEFVDVPPLFMQGGASHTTYPIAIGDYCLLIFTERCFDRWYEGQDFRRPPELRMHDYSDGFAIVGINPKASALTIPDVITQVGDTHQEGNYEHTGDVEQTGDYTLDGDMTINGNLTVNGDITCTGTLMVPTAVIGGIDFATHVHGGVTSGSGSSGVPQ